MKITDAICLAASICGKLQPFARDAVLLFSRMMIGWSFFLTGKGKLANLERTSGFFESLGIPAPGFHAGLVGGVEMIGGILLLIGLLSRVAAVPLAFSMVVALLTAHREEVFESLDGMVGESPFPYLIVSLVIIAFGPGRVALDTATNHLLCKRTVHE